MALEGTALTGTPRLTISGRAGIVKHHTLNNRREVLTADAAGRVTLWNVMRGCQVADLGADESIDTQVRHSGRSVHPLLTLSIYRQRNSLRCSLFPTGSP